MPVSRLVSAALAGSLVSLLAVLPAHAAAGDLDPTFDGDGKVTTDFVGFPDRANAIVRQPDGKLVVAGVASVGGTGHFALARYNTDGSLDPSFDGDGRVTTLFSAFGFDEIFALAIQPDGKIVAAGQTHSGATGLDFALARYNTDGSLDVSFDGDGKVVTDFAGDVDSAHALVLQPDGKIVAAGEVRVAFVGDFGVARYNADGSLDVTFDGDGRVTTDFAGGFDTAHTLVLQPDGKLVAAGGASVPGNTDFGLARYNSDGSPDVTFDGDGKVTTDFAGSFDDARALVLQPDNKLVAAGVAVPAPITTSDFGLARYNSDGSLDVTFDGDGKVTTDIVGANEFGRAIVLQPDGKLVVAGETALDSSSDFALARYTSTGALDATFSGDGKLTTDFFGAGDFAKGLVLQPDGKLVAAGYTESGGLDFALARYLGDPPPATQNCNGLAPTVVGTTGTNGDDVIVGTPGDDYIEGKGGNDRICGLAGNDILRGEDGDDILQGGEGNDALRGGTGNDTLRGGAGNDDVRGEAGDDDSRGGLGADQIVEKGDGNIGDEVAGDNGNENLSPGDVCRVDPGDAAFASCDTIV